MTSKKNRAIAGIGIDIEDIARFRKKPFGKNKAFYKKIFTEEEIKYCLKKPEAYQHFAARFCAKEAFIKAVNKKISDYSSIEVLWCREKLCIKWGRKTAMLSISHDKAKAIAVVVVEE